MFFKNREGTKNFGRKTKFTNFNTAAFQLVPINTVFNTENPEISSPGRTHAKALTGEV